MFLAFVKFKTKRKNGLYDQHTLKRGWKDKIKEDALLRRLKKNRKIK